MWQRLDRLDQRLLDCEKSLSSLSENYKHLSENAKHQDRKLTDIADSLTRVSETQKTMITSIDALAANKKWVSDNWWRVPGFLAVVVPAVYFSAIYFHQTAEIINIERENVG
jgi:septal ring factor EnvC (AmiA/AmiB activator)